MNSSSQPQNSNRGPRARFSNISLYCSFLNTRTSSGYVILSSIENIPLSNFDPEFFVEKDFDPSFKPGMVPVPVAVPNTDIKVNKPFPQLTDIEKQDVISWVAKFKKLLLICK